MTKRIFEHIGVDLGYTDLVAVTTEAGRVYQTPSGKKYPSITTVLGHFGKHKLMEWRKAVGEEEANRIGRHASSRGTALHTICERYIDNKEDIFGKNEMPHVKAMFASVKQTIDERVGKVYVQEVPLYSDHLRLAGRVDLIAEFDDVISVIDFKTSSRIKTSDDIRDYFEQESAYAIMFEERTNIPIVNLVTIMAVENETKPLIFKEHRDNHADNLIRKIRLYEKEKGIRYE
jgi:genome maintenance exonuclease 1